MLERELTELSHVPRWTITRNILGQSVMDHTARVALFANDLCIMLGLATPLHMAVLQSALWHDMDEQFSGDLPGPNKRALLGPEGRQNFDEAAGRWMDTVFPGNVARSGGMYDRNSAGLVKNIVKTADCLDAAVYCASEAQLGNINLVRHINPNINAALDYLKAVCIQTETTRETASQISHRMIELVHASRKGLSKGPWVTGEDERNGSHDPRPL